MLDSATQENPSVHMLVRLIRLAPRTEDTDSKIV
jgi:hypothetical protein